MENVLQEKDVIINFPIKITNPYIVPKEFINECIIKAVNPIITKDKISKSNKVEVNLNIDLTSPHTKDDTEKLIEFYYWLYWYYCCCLCNKD